MTGITDPSPEDLRIAQLKAEAERLKEAHFEALVARKRLESELAAIRIDRDSQASTANAFMRERNALREALAETRDALRDVLPLAEARAQWLKREWPKLADDTEHADNIAHARALLGLTGLTRTPWAPISTIDET